jgi:DNA-binding HxlR family transcriptional regulator
MRKHLSWGYQPSFLDWQLLPSITIQAVRAGDTSKACSIARCSDVIGERWTLLILREALSGATRFQEFRETLGIAPDVLSDRLATLVDAGVLRREPYREPGARARSRYELTPAGGELLVVLGALQQWGDVHLPHPLNPTVARRDRHDGRPLRVAFVDDLGREVALRDVQMLRTPTHPLGASH